MPARDAIQAFVARLVDGVGRGPLIKAFPTKAVKRIDLERFRVGMPDAPERLVETLVQPEGQLVLRFEDFAEQGDAGDERRALFSVLRTKLQREAQFVFRETGLRTLWFAYPTLYVPDPSADAVNFLLAPLFLWPIRIAAGGMGEGELIVVRDKDGGAPRFNRVATAWIRRFLEFEPTEPAAGAIRDIETLADVEALCVQFGGSFRPTLNVDLAGRVQAIPSRNQLANLRGPTLLNSGLIGLIQWENQELIQDLEALARAEEFEGAVGEFLSDPEPRPRRALTAPEELDRYLVTDTDASQERAIWLARRNEGLVVHGPPGTGKSQVIVNIVADALAHGQTVLVVCQKKAALDVVAARLRAHDLGDLCLQVDDAEADRRRVIEALRTQRRPDGGRFEDERQVLAETITRIEGELDTYRRALFDVRQTGELSYRRMLGRLASLQSERQDVTRLARLRAPLSGLRYPEIQRLARLFGELEAVYGKADPLRNPWRHAHLHLSGTPEERTTIAVILGMLETAAAEVDSGVHGPGERRWELRGDLGVLAEGAAALQLTLPDLHRRFKRPVAQEQWRPSAIVDDVQLRDGMATADVLLRWQTSPLRVLTPAYYRAARRFRRLIVKHPWLAASCGGEVLNHLALRARVVVAFCQALKGLGEWLEEASLRELEGAARRGDPVTDAVSALRDRLPTLPALVQWRAMVKSLTQNEGQVLDALLQTDISDRWATRIELAALTAWVREAARETPVLQGMSPELYNVRKAELGRALARKRELETKAIEAIWARKCDQADLRWCRGLSVRGSSSRRLREIVEAWRPGLMSLRPCWLMKPGTVSQLFPLQPGLFDLVVFDEASQCPPEYAVPALYRGRRAIVAGDAKQLPPTMFFKSTFDFEEEGEPVEEITDGDAIVDRQTYAVTTGAEDLLALAQTRLPEAHLNVHYRSRDSRLIAFSNAAFYGNRLQTPPAAMQVRSDGIPALSLVRLDGRYTTSRVNPREAEAVVECIRSVWATEGRTPTLGVVTFNEPQQQLILDRLDDLARRDPHFGTRYTQEVGRKEEGQDVGFFVKNLEAVQGDERDIMLFSTTYGPRDDRPFTRAFLGPLNRAGGERRLNVAISRAKLWVRIFTSLPIEQIADVTSAETIPTREGVGRVMLQLYLLYADAVTKGSDAAAAILDRAFRLGGYTMDPAESQGTEDSEFEVEVGDRLRLLGYRIDPQVGSGAFRIDLGVRHPKDPGAYVLGIECDGRAYHSAPAARAYDLWRQRILEERGWRVHRIWSTAWRHDPEGELAKVEEIIREQLRARDPRQLPDSNPTVESDQVSTSATLIQDVKPRDVSSVTEKPSSTGKIAAGPPEPDAGKPPAKAERAKRAVERIVSGEGRDRASTKKPAPSATHRERFGGHSGAASPSAKDVVSGEVSRRLPVNGWNCASCAASVQLWFGRRGPFLKCTAIGCGRTTTVENLVLRDVLEHLSVSCLTCGASARAVWGPHGAFIGCSSYPGCRWSRSWRDLRDHYLRASTD